MVHLIIGVLLGLVSGSRWDLIQCVGRLAVVYFDSPKCLPFVCRPRHDGSVQTDPFPSKLGARSISPVAL